MSGVERMKKRGREGNDKLEGNGKGLTKRGRFTSLVPMALFELARLFSQGI